MQHDERSESEKDEEDHVKGIKREVEEVVMNYYIRSYMTSDGVPGMSLLKQTCKISLLILSDVSERELRCQRVARNYDGHCENIRTGYFAKLFEDFANLNSYKI
jgi:hypothetical protein